MRKLFIFILSIFLSPAFLRCEEKPKAHEPNPVVKGRAEIDSDAIYAKKPARPFEEAQEALLKEAFDSRKKINEIGQEFEEKYGESPYLQIVETRLKFIRENMKSPKGVSAQNAFFYQNRENVLAKAKDAEAALKIINSASNKIAKLTIGKEICNSIYSNERLGSRSEAFITEKKLKTYKNNAGANFSIKVEDGSYFTFCEFPRYTRFLLHFDKELKLVEVYQSDRYTDNHPESKNTVRLWRGLDFRMLKTEEVSPKDGTTYDPLYKLILKPKDSEENRHELMTSITYGHSGSNVRALNSSGVGKVEIFGQNKKYSYDFKNLIEETNEFYWDD